MNFVKPPNRLFPVIEILLVVLFACVPLFSSFPYRINIFLSWDGAYRISQGEFPYKDFGLPLGYGYWIIPSFFFKLFGPEMITLIKAQAFINIISGLAFITILKQLKVHPYIRFASLLVYIFSYSFPNFWPWYNHTVIVYEFISLAFLLKYLLPENKSLRNPTLSLLWIVLSAFFIFLSFFTKQDGGGLGLLICLALLVYDFIIHRKIKPIIVFILGFIITALIFILPVLPYNFGYWFNHGQPPHSSRFSIVELISMLMSGSIWLKFYILLSVILLQPLLYPLKSFFRNERLMFITLVSFGILAEAIIFQFTSYVPPDNNIFFHSFGFMFILTLLNELNILKPASVKSLYLLTALVVLWWSQVYWKYIDRKIQRTLAVTKTTSPTGENLINQRTYFYNLDTNIQSKWVFTSVPGFKKIYMPHSTVDGINRLISNKTIQSEVSNNRILNMTELTPLSYVMGFKPERGSEYPLWYHLGVGMFNKQKDMYCTRISQNYYDAVFYEYIPALNNFYPFEVRNTLRQNYTLIDSFMAPRMAPTNGTIEIYIKKQVNNK